MKRPTFGRRGEHSSNGSAPESRQTENANGSEFGRSQPVLFERGRLIIEPLLRLVKNDYSSSNGLHASSIVGALAAFAGDTALRAAARAAGKTLPENGWIVGGLPDPLLYGTALGGQFSVWHIVSAAAVSAGAEISDLPDMQEIVARTAAGIGSAPFPPLSVEQGYYPRDWSPNAVPRLREKVDAIANAEGLTLEEILCAHALALAALIGQTKDVLRPAVTATLIAEIMIGVSRMAPLKAEVH